MKYQIVRNKHYDYLGQSYASVFPNLHKYPATMLPQIGIDILKEFGVNSGRLLDPYCGSGSSFASGLACGIKDMYGFDINPLAVLISRVKFTKICIKEIGVAKQKIREGIFDCLKNDEHIKRLVSPNIKNMDFWFSKHVIERLNVIKHFIDNIQDEKIKNLFLLPFSETVRECSYTRNNEFKLYKMKSEDILHFNPDVIAVYLNKLENITFAYESYYYPLIEKDIQVQHDKFSVSKNFFDVVLTSPPYGDSRTTVAYGQFSTLSNEWIGIDYARKIDRMLMGGIKASSIITKGLIADYIAEINQKDGARALEVSAFYNDLECSIGKVAESIKKGGKSIYVVGNRTVKEVQLPTDQFIAEKFEQYGCKHLVTYERALTGKSMPSKNSPTNKTGKTVNTMLFEYIVVCEKQ
jgi:hypothetical protein